jgi:hypothetical protein
MKSIKVVNVKNSKYDIYIGRGSKWGNPFKIGNGNTRENVIKLYEDYLLNSRELVESLQELQGKVLGCHCFPLNCHGNILKKYVEKVTNS